MGGSMAIVVSAALVLAGGCFAQAVASETAPDSVTSPPVAYPFYAEPGTLAGQVAAGVLVQVDPGSVKEEPYEGATGWSFRSATVRVEERISGWLPGQTVEVIEMDSDRISVVKQGDRLLLFLSTTPRDYPYSHPTTPAVVDGWSINGDIATHEFLGTRSLTDIRTEMKLGARLRWVWLRLPAPRGR